MITVQTSMTRRSNIAKALLLVLALGSLGATGCSWFSGKPDYVVPVLDSAKEQMEVVRDQYARARQTIGGKVRREELEKTLAACNVMLENYPKDRVHTPTAALIKAETYRALEDHENAEIEYRRMAAEYPDVKDIHVASLYGLAQTLESQKRVKESKEVLRQLIETYQVSGDPAIRKYVTEARIKYRKIL